MPSRNSQPPNSLPSLPPAPHPHLAHHRGDHGHGSRSSTGHPDGPSSASVMGGPSTSSRHQHHASPSLDALRSALPPPPAPSGAGAGGVGGVGVIGGKVKAKASTRVNIVDRSLAPLGITASGDVYALLFSELVQYSRNRVTSVTELEARLAVVGGRVGQRALTLLAVRDAGGPAGGGGGGGSGGLGGSGGVLGGKAAAGAGKREVRVLGVLNLVVSGVWKFLFGKQADGLKKVNDSEDECTFLGQWFALVRGGTEGGGGFVLVTAACVELCGLCVCIVGPRFFLSLTPLICSRVFAPFMSHFVCCSLAGLALRCSMIAAHFHCVDVSCCLPSSSFHWMDSMSLNVVVTMPQTTLKTWSRWSTSMCRCQETTAPSTVRPSSQESFTAFYSHPDSYVPATAAWLVSCGPAFCIASGYVAGLDLSRLHSRF